MKYIPKIMLGLSVWKKIEWFTHNMTTEIGAVGTVDIIEEDGDKFFYVDNIYFPKQHVTGATVHFTGEMWGDLIKEVPQEDLGRIGFYWHRHPAGSPHHSSTDEDDTFETFMSKDAKPARPYFAFVQSALKDGNVIFEARIDIRDPIRATILDENVDVVYEMPKEDAALEEECKAIKEKCIVKTVPTYKPGFWRNNKQNILDAPASRADCNKYGAGYDGLEAEVSSLFGKNVVNTKTKYYVDNDLINGVPTADVAKASLEFVNGQATVIAGENFQKVMVAALDVKGKLSKYVRQAKPTDMGKNRVKYNLQPKAGAYEDMTKTLKAIFVKYNSYIQEKMDAAVPVNPSSDWQNNQHTIVDGYVSDCVLHDIQDVYKSEWSEDGSRGTYYKKTGGMDYVGYMSYDTSTGRLTAGGKALVAVVKYLENKIREEFGNGLDDPVETSITIDASDFSKEIKKEKVAADATPTKTSKKKAAKKKDNPKKKGKKK